jgi:predicted nucleotidyltransferase
VIEALRATVGDKLIGAYAHGSAVLGGLRPTSDLDILAVVSQATTPDERRELTHSLLDISGSRAHRGPARPVELTIVVQSDVRPWRFPPRVEFLYGEWRRDDYERGFVPEPEPMPDFGPEIALALRGTALLGPPPAEVLDPVPPSDLRRAIVAGVPSLLGDLDTDTRNVLLTLARILATLTAGEILPKDVAAELVAHRLSAGPARAALVRARQMYIDGRNDQDAPWTGLEADARLAAGELVSEIAGIDLE